MHFLDKMGELIYYDITRRNKETSLQIYKETKTLLKERFDGETGLHIKLNSQCVLDGLNKVIMLKEKELHQYIQMKNLEGNK